MSANQRTLPIAVHARRLAASLMLALAALLLLGGSPALAEEAASYLIDEEALAASLEDETDFDASDGSVATPTASLDQSAVVNENASDFEVSLVAVSEDGTADEADEAELSTLATPSINATSVTIYGLDTWEEDLVSIPSGCATSYQLKVTGASSVSYSVTSGDAVTVSSSGLIEGAYTTWYWSGSIGTTWAMDSYDKITVDGDYGSATIKVTADGTTFTVSVEFVDYGEVYAEQVMQDYIDENITSSMSTYEQVEAMCSFVASYDYSASYSSAQGMILSGGGDCWSSTYTIIKMSGMLGLEAWARNGNRDSGSGSGHMNALVKDPDASSTYYEAEAGYTGTAPRAYSVTTRTSLFSYRSVTGGIEVYQYDGNEDEEGTLTVPSTIDGYTVVGIGEYFIQGEDWDGVSLPSTITYIDAQAFYYCTNLTSITLPSSLETIGQYALTYCTSLKTITIPASVTSIGSYNFMDCTALTAITVTSGNTAYCSSSGVLYNASKTTLVFYPANKSGTSFTVPSTVTTIGLGAFYKAQNLTSVTLQSGLTTIEDLAFQNADGLTSITIPATVTSLGTQAFTYCDNLATVSLSEGLTTINGYAFYSCSSLASITIPSTVTTIGNYAFAYSTSLGTITFMGDAPSLGTNVFYGLTLTAYYPCSNSTWTSSVTGASYGESSITWTKSHTLASGAKISGSTITGTCSDCGSSVTQTLTITLSTTSYTYNGAARKPTVTVKADGTKLTSGTDYSVSYSNNTNVGTGKVTITGKGTYTGSTSKTFTITAKSVSSATVTLSTTSYTYNGSARKPTPTVKLSLNGSTVTLDSSTDYTVSYSSNKSVGTATCKVTGTGNYTGTATATFTIKAKSLSSATVTLSTTSYTYNGSAKKPTPTVKISLNGSTVKLTKGTDYTVSYSSNKSAGTATCKVTGTGNYTGTATATFTIAKQALKSSRITLSGTSYTYTGNSRTPSVTVKNSSGTKLTKGTDYTISYSKSTRKAVGTYTITIKGKGNYKGTVKVTYKIVPKKVTVKSVKSSATKKATVKWTKLSSANVTKYQIRYRVKGTSTWKKITVSSSKSSYTLTGLKSGKTYQVQVRAYKTVSGKNYTGSWSSTKTVKVK